jgi:hypothetical protein
MAFDKDTQGKEGSDFLFFFLFACMVRSEVVREYETLNFVHDSWIADMLVACPRVTLVGCADNEWPKRG